MEQDDRVFIAAFEAADIPSERWGHREHVRMGFIYLSAHPFEEAVARMRRGIQTLNGRIRVRDSRTSGYHATLTVAWARLIAAAIAEEGPFADSEALLRACPRLLGRHALQPYYSRDAITTDRAKAAFVEPDLAPLPALASEP